MRRRILLAVFLLAAAGLLAGCGKKSPSSLSSPGTTGSTGSAADQAAVAGTLALVPEVVEDGQFESADTTSLGVLAPGGAGAAGAQAAIQPLRFWRTIANVTRSFRFAFADTDTTGRPTRAQVTVDKRLTGRFNILVGVPGSDAVPMDSTFRVVHKPLEDHWVRRILLHRATGSEHWHVVGTSGVQVTSQGAATRITSVRIQTANVDTTITDPLTFIYLRRILRIAEGDSVRVTATTLRNDDLVFLVLRRHRLRFHNNGDDTYSATIRMPFRIGLGHFGVNALSHGTLFDDTAPYDSRAWLFPYLIWPEQLAEEMP
jgi:hypothetical protein